MTVLYHAEHIAEGIGDGGHADAPTNVLYVAILANLNGVSESRILQTR